MLKTSLLFVLLLTGLAQEANAQPDTVKKRIALFAPLYLDSAFNELDEYRYAKTEFPKFINPGLEFYEGAQLALDSLNKEKAPLEVYVYDTRSARMSLAQQLKKAEYDRVELLIAHSTSLEIKQFADAALRMKVPLINANIPNDGGSTGNPYLVLLNPTLKTNCEGIYQYIQKQYAQNKVIVFRKKGMLEDRIRGYFDDYAKQTVRPALKLRYVDLPDSFTVKELRPYLDTLQTTVCLAATLDDNFGKRLIQQLAALRKQKYQAVVMGMPTWDAYPLTRPEYKGIEIVYCYPFYHPRTDKLSEHVLNHFSTVMFARPSDMVFRGFETLFRFARLLLENGNELASCLSTRTAPLFTDFDIQPVLNRDTMTLDYFENKKLYFVKWMDGIIKGVQ